MGRCLYSEASAERWFYWSWLVELTTPGITRDLIKAIDVGGRVTQPTFFSERL